MSGDIIAPEQSSAPGTPSSGLTRTFPALDGRWYNLDDAGNIYAMSGDRQLPPVMRMAAGVSAGATSIATNISLNVPSGQLGWIVIDAWTSECEIRQVSSVSGQTINFASALAYAHATQDVVLWLFQPLAIPEWFGADPTGTNDSTTAFTRAKDQLASGGLILGGGPGATYRLDSSVTITVSNLTIDMRGATCKSTVASTRFIFNGDSGTDGDWSDALYNVWFRNARLGTANDADNQFLGPQFEFCIDSGAENVAKQGLGGTSFNVLRSRRITLRNCVTYGARTSSGAFGFLIHVSDDTLLDSCSVVDGAFYYAYQVKGGRNNVLQNCLARNIAAAGSVTPRIAFRDRGDAPWKASATNPATTYPYSSGSWGAADSQRACHNTRYVNCRVEQSAVVGYLAQEAVGTIFENCSHDDDVTTGFLVQNVSSPGAVSTTLTAQATAGDTTLSVVSSAAFAAGDGIYLELDATVEGEVEYHFSVVSSVGAGTISIMDPVPSTAASGNDVGHTLNGSERDFTLKNCYSEGNTSGDIVIARGESGNLLPGVRITDSFVQSARGNGISLNYTTDALVQGCEVKNSGQDASGTKRGIVAQNSEYPRLLENLTYDSQGSPTQQYGILIPTNSLRPTMRGNRGYSNTAQQVDSRIVGYYSDNWPADATKQTTDNAYQDDAWRCLVRDNTVVWIEVLAVADRDTHADRAVYKIGGLFYAAAGTVTQQGATQNLITGIETAANYDVRFTTSTNTVRFNVRGETGHNVNWRVFAQTWVVF